MKLSTFLLTFIVSILFNFSIHGQDAKFQIIHNCPDTIVDTVDVYINDTLFISGFAFQNAMPYIDIPANTAFDLTITSFGKGDTISPLLRKTYSFSADSAFIAVLGGEVGNTGANGFDLRQYIGQLIATNQGNGEVSVKFIHDSYDAPAYNIYELLVIEGEIIPFLNFGQDSGYIELDPTDLIFQLRGQSSQVLGQFSADFIPFEDSALVILSTGLYDTTDSAGITPFGMIAVLSTGAVINLTPLTVSPARIQIIHNCAAADASSIDVWMNAGPQPLVNDLAFRTATPFMDFPAGEQVDISICLPGSTDTTSALFHQSFMFESDKKYIIIASGIIGSGSYNPSIPFSLDVIPDAREAADIPTDLDLMFWNGTTDAPILDIVETGLGIGVFFDDVAYQNSQGYISIAPQNYEFAVKDSADTTDLFSAHFDASFSAYDGQAITLLTSGFLNTANNNNGPEFGLWIALPTGGNLIPLGIIIGTDELTYENIFTLFPNPASEKINLNSQLKEVSYKIFNSGGLLVKSGNFQNVINQNIDVANLDAGLYFIQLISENKISTKTFCKL